MELRGTALPGTSLQDLVEGAILHCQVTDLVREGDPVQAMKIMLLAKRSPNGLYSQPEMVNAFGEKTKITIDFEGGTFSVNSLSDPQAIIAEQLGQREADRPSEA